MDRTQAIRRQFGAAAPLYGTSCVHATGPDLAAMLEAVSLRGDERALDLGCGAGHTAVAFAPRVGEVVALDLTDAMLAETERLAAERGVGNLRVRNGDASELPFPDDHFELVTCRLSAHHYARPARAVREAARVLRPGGTLLLVDTVSPEDPAQDTFCNAFELLRDASHVRNHSVSQWLAMLGDAGFAARLVSRFGYRIDFDDWVARMATPPTAVSQLRALFAEAPAEMRRVFGIDPGPPLGFEIPGALLLARSGARTHIS